MNSNQKHENLLKSIEEMEDYAFFFLDLDGVIQTWNLGAKKIKGYNSDEILGKSFRCFYTNKDIEEQLPDKLLETALQKGKAFIEGWRVRKDGSQFWGSVLITTVHKQNGEAIGFGKLTRDLTDKKLIDQLTDEYCQKLKEMLEMTSHRVRSPLTKCLGLMNLLVPEEKIDKKEFEEIINHLKSSAMELNTFTEELTNHLYELEQKYRNKS